MQNADNVITPGTGTNPLLTIAIFFGIIIAVVCAGAHFSQRNNAAKDLEIAMEKSVGAEGSIGR